MVPGADLPPFSTILFPRSGPKRYDYSPAHKEWFYSRDNTTMRELLNTELGKLMKNDQVRVDLGEGEDQ